MLRQRIVGQHEIEFLLTQGVEAGFRGITRDDGKAGHVKQGADHFPDVPIVLNKRNCRERKSVLADLSDPKDGALTPSWDVCSIPPG